MKRLMTNIAALGMVGCLALVTAGCGGGGGLSKSDEAALQQQLEEAEAAAAEAEAARKAAEAEAAEAEAARKAAEAEAAAAETARAAEEAAAAAAAAEAQRLREEEEARVAEQNQAKAKAAFDGLGGGLDTGTRIDSGTVTVTPRYGQTATVTTDPAVVFETKRRSTSGRWSITTLANDSSTHKDDLVVYSDIGGPKPTPIRQAYKDKKTFTEVTDNTSYVTFPIVAGDADDISSTSSLFPRGGSNTAGIDITVDSNDDDTDDRTALIPGKFDGASGHYQCEGTSESDCTIRHTGSGYVLTGNWTFRVLKSAKVNVNDDSYMHFGWWKREEKSDESHSFEMFSGGMHPKTTFPVALTGTATYTGPAVGQYAIYQPLGTQTASGSFTARAELTANFGATNVEGTLSGRVTNFSNASDWSVALNSQSISSIGAVVRANDSVSWTIGGKTEDSGGWAAQFFYDVSISTAYPEGVAGTFDAKFESVGRLIGAFGAHCPTSTCPRN